MTARTNKAAHTASKNRRPGAQRDRSSTAAGIVEGDGVTAEILEPLETAEALYGQTNPRAPLVLGATLHRMTGLASFNGASRRLWLLAGMVALATSGSGCHTGSGNPLADLDRARALGADLRVQFSKAEDASDHAVMADTDEASFAYAHDAEKATQVIDSDVARFGTLLKNLGFADEVQALEEFKGHWAKYGSLDRNILALAVENTNLKAQRLSFGPAREAADAFCDAVARIAADANSKDRCRIDLLTARATIAIREIQVLQAPHIAEAQDAVMTRIEQEMARLDLRGRAALEELTELAEPNTGPTLAAALASLDRFREISRQIVSLSRRNTNVRSLELSLREKPTLAAACDAGLQTLQRALANKDSKATR